MVTKFVDNTKGDTPTLAPALKGKKFALSYSGGKDCIFAMHQAQRAGMEPVCLLIMTHEDNGESWAHGIPSSAFKHIGKALNLPVIGIPSDKETYALNLEEGLRKAKTLGAEYCVFGDLLDIPPSENWNIPRCENAGLQALNPLMGCDRKQLLTDFVSLGYRTIISCVNTDFLSEDFLGKVIDFNLIQQLESTESDICGENGEYHSFAFDGPSFKHSLTLHPGQITRFANSYGHYAAIDLFE